MRNNLVQIALALLEEATVRCQRPADKREEFIKDFAAFLKQPSLWSERETIPLTDSQQAAFSIMGQNMLQLSDVEQHLKVSFTAEQREQLSIVPWTPEELEACKSTHVLFPGYPVTLNELRKKVRRGFCSNLYCWDKELKEPFVNDERVTLTWHLVRKDLVPGTNGLAWEEQEQMVPDGEHIPNAVTFAFGIVLFWKTRNVRLFRKFAARTCSTEFYESEGCAFQVHLGGFLKDGMWIGAYFGRYLHERDWEIGLASARNLPR